MKMLKKGIDILDQNDDVKFIGSKKVGGLLERIRKVVANFTEFITPLGERTALIKLQEDKSVASLFETYRFLIALSMINLVIFTLLVIYQHTQEEIDLFEMCHRYIPCFMLYSSFGKELGFVYAFQYFIFIVIGLYSCIYKWVIYDRQASRIEIFNDHQFPVSQRLFNAWNWQTDKENLVSSYCSAVYKDIKFELGREEIEKNIKKRNFNQKVLLLLRRTVSTLINMAVIFSGLYAIIYIEDQQDEITAYIVREVPLT